MSAKDDEERMPKAKAADCFNARMERPIQSTIKRVYTLKSKRSRFSVSFG